MWRKSHRAAEGGSCSMKGRERKEYSPLRNHLENSWCLKDSSSDSLASHSLYSISLRACLIAPRISSSSSSKALYFWVLSFHLAGERVEISSEYRERAFQRIRATLTSRAFPPAESLSARTKGPPYALHILESQRMNGSWCPPIVLEPVWSGSVWFAAHLER